MFKDITLGQYYPAKSFVHSMDPRAKLLLTVVYIAAACLASSAWGYLVLAAYVAAMVRASNVPVKKVLRSLKPLRFILVFTFIMNLFMGGAGQPLFSVWIIRVTDTSLRLAVSMALRLVFLLSGTSLMTLTTSPIDLTDGLESLLSPLKVLKFPAHELAMMMTIALRMIPTLLEEADKIMKAQMARGADFETGSIFKRARRLLPLLIPLFFSAFRRADDLGMAMESRCYQGGEGRTHLKVLAYSWRDLVALILILALAAAVVLLRGI